MHLCVNLEHSGTFLAVVCGNLLLNLLGVCPLSLFVFVVVFLKEYQSGFLKRKQQL